MKVWDLIGELVFNAGPDWDVVATQRKGGEYQDAAVVGYEDDECEISLSAIDPEDAGEEDL